MFVFAATERPRLKLQPRSKPRDAPDDTAVPSAIFGGAKPVDTAAREKEIAARLEKDKTEKDSRESERRRYKSSGSEDGERR